MSMRMGAHQECLRAHMHCVHAAREGALPLVGLARRGSLLQAFLLGLQAGDHRLQLRPAGTYQVGGALKSATSHVLKKIWCRYLPAVVGKPGLGRGVAATFAIWVCQAPQRSQVLLFSVPRPTDAHPSPLSPLLCVSGSL